MKKILMLVVALSILSAPMFAVDSQQDLAIAVAKQKESADNARWEGFTGIGLEIGGYILYAVGIANTASLSTTSTTSASNSKAAESVGYLTAGGFMILGGAVTSFLGWLSQLDANDRQAQVNKILLDKVSTQ